MAIEDGVFQDINRRGLVTSPTLATIILLYLLIVLKIGPSYMNSRPAYSLKSFIVVYNIFQIIACVYLVYQVLIIDLPTIRFWKCNIYFENDSPAGLHFEYIAGFTFWLKMIELSETVVFVLRKKQRQVSFLHVFHHCATLFLVNQISHAYKDGTAFFPLYLNCCVHIVMYLYYLMAAVLPEHVVVKLLPVKKAITTVQMIQFALILMQVVLQFASGCKMPLAIVIIYVSVILLFFYMFYDFYQKNYSQAAKKRAAAAVDK